MPLTDTHTHLYLPEFDADREAVIERAMEAGVNRFLLPNIDETSFDALYGLCDAHPDTCFPMMGLHPCSVKDDYRKTLSRVEDELGSRPFCAVGEIGIDLYWDKTTYKEQADAFLTQIRWAYEAKLPVSIHSRDATDEIIALLRANEGRNPGGVFHCFTGTAAQGEAAIDLGFHLGIGGVLTFKNAGLDKVAAALPLERMVLETDAPYLAPAPHRGKRNEPAYLALVADKIAGLKKVPAEEVAVLTTQNAEKIFKLM